MTTHASASPRSEICRRLDRTPRVYLLGSSTMGSVLGPMLQKDLKKKWGIKAKRWGKASSGLARPDFHDWPAEVPNLMRRHRPDYVVVSLGTNDHQALKTKKGWIKTSNERWAKTYKQRVLIMLRRLSGRDRRRAIVWLGPTNFDSNNAQKLGPKINRLIREAINEFDGPAVFVNARRATSDAKGGPGTTFKHPSKGTRPMRAADGIHLTTEAVRNLLAAPVHKAFGSCWEADIAARDAIRAQRKAERQAKRKAKLEARKAAREEQAKKRALKDAAQDPKQAAKQKAASSSTDTAPAKGSSSPTAASTSDKAKDAPKARSEGGKASQTPKTQGAGPAEMHKAPASTDETKGTPPGKDTVTKAPQADRNANESMKKAKGDAPKTVAPTEASKSPDSDKATPSADKTSPPSLAPGKPGKGVPDTSKKPRSCGAKKGKSTKTKSAPATTKDAKTKPAEAKDTKAPPTETKAKPAEPKNTTTKDSKSESETPKDTKSKASKAKPAEPKDTTTKDGEGSASKTPEKQAD